MLSLTAIPVFAEKTDISQREISSYELGQRVAVLKRFKELLKAQRDRLRAYLDTMDKQQEIIQRGTADDLLRHVELEEKIVEDIFTIQRVIDPLEDMYHSLKETSGGQTGENELISLKEVLYELKYEAIHRSGQNRELLAKRMAELRSEINSLKKNPYAGRRLNFAPAPVHVDIRG